MSEQTSSQVQASCNVSLQWATKLCTILCERVGPPIVIEQCPTWVLTEDGYKISVIRHPSHCVVIYSQQCNQMGEFLTNMLVTAELTPSSFMGPGFEGNKIDKELLKKKDKVIPISKHPNFRKAPINGTDEQWDEFLNIENEDSDPEAS